jgi:hypothetical protein
MTKDWYATDGISVKEMQLLLRSQRGPSAISDWNTLSVNENIVVCKTEFRIRNLCLEIGPVDGRNVKISDDYILSCHSCMLRAINQMSVTHKFTQLSPEKVFEWNQIWWMSFLLATLEVQGRLEQFNSLLPNAFSPSLIQNIQQMLRV